MHRALHSRLGFVLYRPDEGGGGGGDGGNGGAATTFTQEQVNDMLAREKGKLTAKYGDYDALKTKASELDTLKAASQSDAERLTGQVSTLTGENTSLKGEMLRLKVALKLGFTGERAELAPLLQGSNEAEMEEHGNKLAAMFKGGGTTSFDGGTRGNGEGQPQSMDDLIRGARSR